MQRFRIMPLLFRFFHGKGKFRPYTKLTFYVDFFIVSFNDMLNNGQTEARTAFTSTPTLINPVKTFEQAWDMPFGDTLSIVGYANDHFILYQIFNAYFRGAVFISVLDRDLSIPVEFFPYPH